MPQLRIHRILTLEPADPGPVDEVQIDIFEPQGVERGTERRVGLAFAL